MRLTNGKVTALWVSALVVVVIGFTTVLFGIIERNNKAEAVMFDKRIEACDDKNADQDEVINKVIEGQAEMRTGIRYIREDIAEIKELLKD